jgi:hypothetical protein
MLRTIAISPLLAGANDATFVRGLLDEARANADDLAFRLEGPGCDRLVVCTFAAVLSRTLATLQSQLQAMTAASAGNFGSHL